MADSTYKTRRCQWRHYLQFCALFELAPLPASSETVCLYLTYMAETFVYSSIVNYLSAVWVLHRVNNVSHINIHDQSILMTLRGIRRVLGDSSTSAAPITVSDLRKIFRIMDLTKSEDVAFWLSLIMGFRALLRKSNLFEEGLALRVCDITYRPWGLLLTIRRTKTICFKERVLEIPLVSVPFSEFCVRFYSLCLMNMVSYPTHQSHLLSFMRGQNYYQCTYQWFSNRLSSACGVLGLSKYTSHSLHRGGAMALENVDVPLHDIKVIGDWKSLSVLLYLERPLESKIELDRKKRSLFILGICCVCVLYPQELLDAVLIIKTTLRLECVMIVDIDVRVLILV